MKLLKKHRFSEKELSEKAKVTLDINKEPVSVRFKHEKWEHEKDLKVLGYSTRDNLIPNNTPVDVLADMVHASQYILSDIDMNIYEAYIYVVETENGVFGYMTAIETIPNS